MAKEPVKCAVILAGGASTRMSVDKAMVRVGGIPMLHRAATTALKISPAIEVIIAGRDRPDDWPASLKVQFLPDLPLPGETPPIRRSAGPLLGLVSAMEHVRAPLLVLPCDAPRLSAVLLQKLIAAHARGPASKVATMLFSITSKGVEVEPTLAVYTPALLPTLQQMLREDRRALYPLISLAGVTTWEIPPEHEHEILNVNTPENLAEADRLLKN